MSAKASGVHGSRPVTWRSGAGWAWPVTWAARSRARKATTAGIASGGAMAVATALGRATFECGNGGHVDRGGGGKEGGDYLRMSLMLTALGRRCLSLFRRLIALGLDSAAQRSYRERVGLPRVSAFLAVVRVLLAACTGFVPRQYLPYPLANETFGDPVKVVYIPLPVIKTDPNEGLSLGALSAFLLHNKNDEIGTMIVPQVNYNQNFGTTFSLFGAFYPEPGRRWEIPLAKSTHVNDDYTVKFQDSTLLDRRLELKGEVGLFTDGSARFFGFQSRSSSKNETNYADEEQGFN